MARIIWTREALARIDDIRNYIRQFNPRAASRIATRLHVAGDSLARFPRRGRLVGDNLRELPSIRPYVIKYDITAETVYILDIRHSAQASEPVDA